MAYRDLNKKSELYLLCFVYTAVSQSWWPVETVKITEQDYNRIIK